MELRDEDFKKFDVEYCKQFTDDLIAFMKEQKKLQEEKLSDNMQEAEEIK
jgi:polyhydroxyalkanoate synthesis regulator phasin